jgi:hypothetical protein
MSARNSVYAAEKFQAVWEIFRQNPNNFIGETLQRTLETMPKG